MSHGQTRQEKDCLNCGTQVAGPYCQHCGQPNLVPRMSFWQLLVHFFNDVTHFDGKFFSTLKLLFLKPGRLAHEYRLGKRASYLDPVRMYLFTSAAFFLFIYNIFEAPDYSKSYQSPQAKLFIDSVIHSQDTMSHQLGLTYESVPRTNEEYLVIYVPQEYKKGVKGYDSIQALLPAEQRAGWLGRRYGHTLAGVYETFRSNPAGFAQRFNDKFLHSFSKVFFFSLPLFALFLYLLHLGKRKQYYYAAHAVFTMHYFCVFFLLITISVLASEFLNLSGSLANLLLWGGTSGYLVIAMHRFYNQYWLISLFKGVIQYSLFLTSLLVFTIIFGMIALASAGSH